MRTCCTCPDEAGLHTPGPRHPLGQPDRLGPDLLSVARLWDLCPGQQHSCLPASEVPRRILFQLRLNSQQGEIQSRCGLAQNSPFILIGVLQ